MPGDTVTQITAPGPVVGLEPLRLEDEGSASLLEVVRLAFGSIASNKTRSLLTTLGVIIGVLAVVTLLSLGAGVTSEVTNQLASMGTNTLFVSASFPTDASTFSATRAQPLLTMDDAEALAAANLPVVALAPQSGTSGHIVAPAASTDASIVGTTPAYATVSSLELAEGSFFSDDNVRSGSPVIVLGASLKTTLFGTGEAVGQTVRVNDQSLDVIGVLTAQGGLNSADDNGIVPITLLQQRLGGNRTPDGNSYVVSMVLMEARDQADVPLIEARVAMVLRRQHDLAADGSEDDFQVTNMASIMEQATSILGTLTMFLGAIAAISLLVGGIGIMNIMLVSVTERTREIGLRKAVGARGSDILLQFIVEALAISLIGGLIGLALGALITFGISSTGLLTASVTASAALIAVGFSLAVGLFFGIYPAQRAARLNPIDALRHE
ncbi:MAG: ABC transporter permease [Anaerolineae bacterium]